MPASERNGDSLQTVDPLPVYFTFSRIRPQFSCGRYVSDTLSAVISGNLKVDDLPLITLLVDSRGNMYSLNNRRLFVFKELARQGLLSRIPVRLRPVPQTKRMAQKYTPEKCALTAKLMGVRQGGASAPDVAEGGRSSSEGAMSAAEGDHDSQKAVSNRTVPTMR